MRAAVSLLLVALGLAGLCARPAAAADWTVKPAANAFAADRQSYRYTVNPGAQVADGIVVSNHGTGALRLTLRSPAAWVRPDQDELIVPPGESSEVSFAVRPAADAAPGDYESEIVAQAGAAKAGIPIRLRVGGPLRPRLAVEDVRMRYSSKLLGKGDATVTFTVHNTGNAILTARPTVAHTRLADSPELLPGAKWRGSARVRGVTPTVRVTATVSVIPLLTDAAGSIAPLAKVEASGHAWAIPWSVLVVLCLLVVAAVAWRRRRTAVALR